MSEEVIRWMPGEREELKDLILEVLRSEEGKKLIRDARKERIKGRVL